MRERAATYRTISARVRRRRNPVGRWYRRNERTVLGIAGVLSFFGLWQLGASTGAIDPFFFSSPVDIARAGADEIVLPRFWNDVRVSLVELAMGALAAFLLAVPLGIAIGWWRRVSYTFDPWLNFFNALPRIALIPLVVLWVGLGIEMKTVIVFLGGFFSIIVPTVQGVRTVDRALLDVARSFRASTVRTFTSLVIPATVPFIITGVRIAIGRMLIGVILAELYAQTDGLGVMIDKAADALRSDRLLFGVLLFSLAGIIATEGVGYLERYFQRWRPSSFEVEEEIGNAVGGV